MVDSCVSRSSRLGSSLSPRSHVKKWSFMFSLYGPWQQKAMWGFLGRRGWNLREVETHRGTLHLRPIETADVVFTGQDGWKRGVNIQGYSTPADRAPHQSGMCLCSSDRDSAWPPLPSSPSICPPAPLFCFLHELIVSGSRSQVGKVAE